MGRPLHSTRREGEMVGNAALIMEQNSLFLLTNEIVTQFDGHVDPGAFNSVGLMVMAIQHIQDESSPAGMVRWLDKVRRELNRNAEQVRNYREGVNT